MSSIFSVQRTEEGSQSTFLRATLRLRIWVRRGGALERSQRILATELPTVPKPSRATLHFAASGFEELVMPCSGFLILRGLDTGFLGGIVGFLLVNAAQ